MGDVNDIQYCCYQTKTLNPQQNLKKCQTYIHDGFESDITGSELVKINPL